jgi:hypothetical protein
MNVLILYDQYSTFTNTVYEHLLAFTKHSRHTFAYSHGEGWVPRIRWDAFDAVIIHYSLRVAYNAIPPRLMRQIAQFRGVKFLFVQDEYDFTERTRQTIETLKVDVVFTCVPPAHREKVYPASRFPNVRFAATYTGFVPEDVDRSENLPISQRAVFCGYRGRALPYWYGDLGQEKQVIAEAMKTHCLQQQIPCDIEWDDSHRIYGDHWLAFLRRCKATLGTESGSNLFDYDGSLRRGFSDYLLRHPNASYREARSAVLGSDFVETPVMNQVSPRIFESIICGTALILFEGEYSGVVKPNLHFIPLRKDFSNIDEVIQRLENDNELQAMADRAFEDVIGGGRYTFSSLVREFDSVLEDEAGKKNLQPRSELVFDWEVRADPARTSQAVLPHWLGWLWHAIPHNIRLRAKPAARRAWDFIESKRNNR